MQNNMANVNPQPVIINGEEYQEERQQMMIVVTVLRNKKTGELIRSVNQNAKSELIRKGYDYLGLPTAGYWGKILL